MTLFLVLVTLVGLERVAELVVARRNASWSLAHGGVEVGAGHYPAMVALHTGLLVGAVCEVWLADRPFLPWLGWLLVATVVAAQALRWWCIRTLGRQWNTRIIVVPGLSRVTAGPYRWLAHPNYVAVAVEGLALPLVHTAWIAATTFTVANMSLMWVRIRAENRALTPCSTS
jgi:methyltransferase